MVTLAATPCLGWGPDGHRIIGEIAWHLLSPRAEQEVERLLERGEFDSLAEVGNWADTWARRFEAYDWAGRLHYVDVEPSASRYVAARDCPEGECVVAAIARFSERLRRETGPAWKRREDFRFLVHFVEDVHQPLHVIHSDMRGGGRTVVRFLGEEVDLHTLWDSTLLERRLSDVAADSVPGDVEAWRRLAYRLRLAIGDHERASWAAETDPAAWADEGIPLARRLTFDIESGEALGEAYYQAAIPVIERRLQMAAVRLAARLNQILAGD